MFVLDIFLGAKCVHADIPVRGTLTVGRDPENALVLPDGGVSRRHMVLRAEYAEKGSTVTLTDCDSMNGTYVNGKRVSEHTIDAEDSVFVGRYQFVFRHGEVDLITGVKDDGDQTIFFSGDPFAQVEDPLDCLQSLHEFSQRLDAIELDDVYQITCETVKSSIPFDTFCVIIDEKSDFQVVASWNQDGPCGRTKISVSQTIVEQCVSTKKPVIAQNLRRDRRFAGVDSIAIKKMSSAMCVPLVAHGEVLGVLYCSTQSTKRPYSHSDLQFLLLVASNVSLVLRHEQSLSKIRVEASKRKAVLEGLGEAVLVCDERFRILLANDAAKRVFRSSNLLGRRLVRTILDAGYKHDFDPAAAAVHRAFYIERREKKAGAYKLDRYRSYQATVSPVTGLEEDGWCHIVCFRDVTNVQRSEQMREVFSFQLAHKLNTPLTLVQSALTFLEDKIQELYTRLGESVESDAETVESIVMGQTNVAHLTTLVERFVQLSDVEVGKAGIESHHEVVDLSTLVSTAIDFASSDLYEAETKVRNDVVDGDVRLVVNSDKIVASFLQVIQNAAKFAGRGAKLSIDYWIDSEGAHIVFTDTGPGIPKEHQEEVFNIFTQIDVDNTGNIPGLGLGLWWAREVVHVHGGDMSLESPIHGDGGTKVSSTLPESLLVETGEDTKFHSIEVEDELDPDVGIAADSRETTTDLNRSAIDLEGQNG